MKDKIKAHRMSLLIWGGVVCITGLYLSLIFNDNVWTDEAFTFDLLRKDVWGIVKGTASDVHPPLYYLYAKIFDFLFGYSVQIQKIAAILPMVGVLVFGATVIRKRFGDLVSLFFILFIAGVPCSMTFAVQIRMYSLALLLVTVCGVYAFFAYESEKGIKNYLIFAITGLLAAYTHYFAFGSVIIITGFLFLALLFTKRKQLAKWLLAAGIMVAGYMPWIFTLLWQINNINGRYWIPPITKKTIWEYFIWAFDSSAYPGVIYGFLIILVVAGILLIVSFFRKKTERTEILFGAACMMVPALTAFSGVVISKYILSSTIYRAQYVFPAMGLLALSFAIGIKKMNKTLLIETAVFLLCALMFSYKDNFYDEYQKTLYPKTKEFFEENLEEQDDIVYNWQLFGFIYKYHFPEEQLVWLGDYDFSQMEGNVWFINTQSEMQVDETVLNQYGLTMEYIGHYGIEHNEFELYKISEK